jgi:hypothetical protein
MSVLSRWLRRGRDRVVCGGAAAWHFKFCSNDVNSGRPSGASISQRSVEVSELRTGLVFRRTPSVHGSNRGGQSQIKADP